ncbi:MAG: hypothetical protein ABI416_04685 [Ginsengibacter sp.]
MLNKEGDSVSITAPLKTEDNLIPGDVRSSPLKKVIKNKKTVSAVITGLK